MQLLGLAVFIKRTIKNILFYTTLKPNFTQNLEIQIWMQLAPMSLILQVMLLGVKETEMWLRM